MIQTVKLRYFRALTSLLRITVVAAVSFGALMSVAGAAGRTGNQSTTKSPVHHKKQVHVSCRQICLADYDVCAAPGAKRGVRSCKTVRNECLAACPAAQ